MSRLKFTRQAHADLLEIQEYIAQDSPAAARRWVAKLREACTDLPKWPHKGPVFPHPNEPGLRTFTVGNYRIFYRPHEDQIQIIRVTEGHRDIDRLLRDIKT